MILKNKYNQMVEKIEVSSEMSERILKNISETEFNKKITTQKKERKLSRILSVAACFVILLIGSAVIPKFINPTQDQSTQVVPNIVEYQSLEELSSELEFELFIPSQLELQMMETKYMLYLNELAEITYFNDTNTIIYRMAKGNDDISGDYNVYDNSKECETDIGTIMLKGNDDGYNLAIWSNNDFSYAISSSKPLSEDEFLKIILSVKWEI